MRDGEQTGNPLACAKCSGLGARNLEPRFTHRGQLFSGDSPRHLYVTREDVKLRIYIERPQCIILIDQAYLLKALRQGTQVEKFVPV